MSADYILWATYGAYGIDSVVLLAGTLRALQLGRGFAGRVFKGRAYWLAGLMIVLNVGNITSAYPSPAAAVTLLDYIISAVGGLSFAGALLIAFVFVDRNIIVLREMDFFHRDTIRWSRIRVPALIALILGSAELVFITVFQANSANPTVFVILTYFPLVAITLGLAAAALVVAARRTPDRTTRRFALFLGLALAFGVMSATVWIPLSLVTSVSLENFISSLPNIVSAYCLYRCAKTLSPLGRIEKVAV